MDKMSPFFFPFLVFTIKDLSLGREARQPARTEVLVLIFGSEKRIKPAGRSAEPRSVPLNNCPGLDHMMLTKSIVTKFRGNFGEIAKSGTQLDFPAMISVFFTEFLK